jgi:DNA-binding response OmpR family regulator
MAKILLVDDDADHNAAVVATLSKENHIVEAVLTGRAGIELLGVCQYELVILDWSLGDMTGIEVLQEIRKFCSTPVLMLTGHARITERAEGLDAGADDYLIKPFSTTELSARIRALLRRGREVAPTLAAGKYTLDPATLTVTSGDKNVRLQPQEFALLEFLCRHPRETFKADVLMNRVWRSDSEAGTDAVRTAVKHIRQRLNDEGVIETIPGSGYKLGS